jgi:uncharacterized membrane protein
LYALVTAAMAWDYAFVTEVHFRKKAKKKINLLYALVTAAMAWDYPFVTEVHFRKKAKKKDKPVLLHLRVGQFSTKRKKRKTNCNALVTKCK